jgi:hypothetical protein
MTLLLPFILLFFMEIKVTCLDFFQILKQVSTPSIYTGQHICRSLLDIRFHEDLTG